MAVKKKVSKKVKPAKKATQKAVTKKKTVTKAKPATKSAKKAVTSNKTAKKAISVKKKGVAKKPAAKKVVTRKKTAKKATPAKKKSVAKKPAAKKIAKKKPAVKKKAAKKVVKKEVPAKMPVAKNKPTKKAEKSQPSTLNSFSKSTASAADRAKGIAARKAAAKAKSAALRTPPSIKKRKSSKSLTKKQARKYELSLLRLRDELSRQIAYLRGASLTRDDEVNVTEDGTDAFERQLALKLAANEGDAIFEIDEALQRIKDGVYAQCEDCGCIISASRLKALPFARRCMNCKSLAENNGGYQQRRFK